MASKRVVNEHHQTFESIRQFDEEGHELWLARQLAKMLDTRNTVIFSLSSNAPKMPAATAVTRWTTISRRSSIWSRSARVPSARLLSRSADAKFSGLALDSVYGVGEHVRSFIGSL